MSHMKVLKIHPSDNVAVCISPLKLGEEIAVDGKMIRALSDIPSGHKILLCDINEGEIIRKYGYPIGQARTDMKCGEWVNEKNIKTRLSGTLEYKYNPTPLPKTESTEPRTFKGYKRENGKVGVRNEIWIIPTVGCVNGIADKLAQRLEAETKLEGIDGIHSWHHNYGCSQLSDDHENTRKVLRDIATHPNAGGVLVLSLGCENNKPEDFMSMLGDYDKERIRLVVTQRVEGDEIEYCMNILRELYSIAKQDKREDISVSELCIGLKCGGSDGFSGITANPLVGRLSDWIVSQGGTTVLTEVPEMFGAETILMDRCKNEELFSKTVKMINDFKEYYISHGEPVGENPSPGNNAGGISTLEEKSLGCIQKGGTSQVCDVLDYAERVCAKGLNLLSAPGNDLVASTALACAGCQIVLFTTGRGTPFGTLVPTMKISTNNELASKKHNWIDFNAGTLLDGMTMEEACNELADAVIEIASGKLTRNEINGYSEIAIFKNGVTL